MSIYNAAMAGKDYYTVLGVDKKASKEEIKKAFHKIAHKHHPDKAGGDAEKFKEASEAYATLSDDKKRAQYDAYGQGFGGGAPGGAGQGFGGFDFSGFDPNSIHFDFGGAEGFDLGDIFGDMFGGARAARTARRGRDISIDVQIPFKESIFGTERTVMLTKLSVCDACKGSGAKAGSVMDTCKTCSGKGSVHESRRTMFGTFATVVPCRHCEGTGKVPHEPCQSCKGAGVHRGREEIHIAIPAGIEHGEMIRLPGQGEAIKSGTAGDLYVKVHVERDPLWQRDGANLVGPLSIKLTEALLGGERMLETPHGPLSFAIPAGSKTGDVLRLKGKGVPMRGRIGDILVRLEVIIPAKLSRAARVHVEGLREEGL